MRWRKARRSTNVEDRRRRGGGRRAAGVGGGALVVAVIGALVFGKDPSTIIDMMGGGSGGAEMQTGPTNDVEEQLADLVSVTMADTEDTWSTIFEQVNAQYQPAKLVLYSGRVATACGGATSASGPFYCPGDSKVYIDLSFMHEMRKMKAPGDFAFAYVVAHEVGHHIQNLIGTATRVREQQARVSKAEANQLSVRMELQADCLAGVWTHHTQKRRQFLEEGDIDEALAAAAAVGDDRIQKQATGTVHPESWTHGSSKQRTEWFYRGAKSGQLDQCNTFSS